MCAEHNVLQQRVNEADDIFIKIDSTVTYQIKSIMAAAQREERARFSGRVESSAREAKVFCSPSVSRPVFSVELVKRKFSGISRKLSSDRKGLKSTNLSVFANKNASRKGCLVNPFIGDMKNNVGFLWRFVGVAREKENIRKAQDHCAKGVYSY